DASQLARFMRIKSHWLAREGHLDEATELFERARRVSDPASARRQCAHDVLAIASAHWQARRFAKARAILEQYIPVASCLEEAALGLIELGHVELEAGEVQSAVPRLEEARRILLHAEWRSDCARATLLLGICLFLQGAREAGQSMLREALAA